MICQKSALSIAGVVAWMLVGAWSALAAPPELTVPRCDDFEVTGAGDAAVWSRTEWTVLERREGGQLDYTARVKALYSTQGIYFLLDASDRRLTVSGQKNDFDDLWLEDVFEVFLWPDERDPVYFEYEISPLNKELPILVPNFEGRFLGWRPWHYVGDRRTRKAVRVSGGEAEPGAQVNGWRAEVFVPYKLLAPLRQVPPQAGTRWRANFYRVDYDDDQTTGWHWAPVGRSFHDYKRFGTLVFEGP